MKSSRTHIINNHTYSGWLSMILAAGYGLSYAVNHFFTPSVIEFILDRYWVAVIPALYSLAVFTLKERIIRPVFWLATVIALLSFHSLGLYYVNGFHADFHLPVLLLSFLAAMHFVNFWLSVPYALISFSILEFVITKDPGFFTPQQIYFTLAMMLCLISGIISGRFVKLLLNPNAQNNKVENSKLLTSNNPIIIADPANLVPTEFNQAAKDLFSGMSLIDIVGKNLEQLFESQPESGSWWRFAEEISNFHNTSTTIHIEHPLSASIWFKIEGSLIDTNGQRFVRLEFNDITEIKQYHQRIQSELIKDNSIMNVILQGIVKFDQIGKLIFINRFASDLLEYDPEVHGDSSDLIGLLDSEELTADDTGETKHVKLNYKKEFVTKSGSRHQLIIHKIKGEDDNSVTFSFSEESASADFNNRDQFELLEPVKIFDKSNQAFAVISSQFKFLKINQTFCELLGYSMEEIMKLTLPDLIHHEDFRSGSDSAEQYFCKESGHNIRELRLIKRDGNHIWISVNHTAAFKTDGKFEYGICLFNDISVRKMAEKTLVENSENISSIIENTRDSIFSVDLENRLLIANGQFRQKFFDRFSKWINPGDNYRDMLTEPLRHQWKENHEKVMRGEPVKYEDHYTGISGHEIYVEVYLHPIYAKNGMITGIACFSKDITDKVESEKMILTAKEQAESAAAAKGNFLATMSHEIRTPLNGVIGMSELLKTTNLLPVQREYVDTIVLSSESLLQIINDILDYSKIESEMLELEQRPFRLKKSLEETFDMLHYKAREKNLDLRFSIDRDVPEMLIGDPGRLRQILVNLVSNAIKFTNHGFIKINVSRLTSVNKEMELVISVKDTGIGIARDAIENLFKPFTQADASTTRNYGGTGLGLAICTRLVSLMKGKIWAESQLGEGSTFYFTIKTMESDYIESKFLNAGIELLQDKRALIVTDNNKEIDMMKNYLTDWKMVPVFTSTLSDALEKCKSEKDYNLVMLDFAMLLPSIVANDVVLKDILALNNAVILFNVDENIAESYQKGWVGSAAKIPAHAPKTLVYNVLKAVVTDQKAEELKPSDIKQRDISESAETKNALKILVAEDNTINQTLTNIILQRLGYKAEFAGNGLEVLEKMKASHFDIIFMDVQMPQVDGLEATRIIVRNYPPEKRPRIIAMTAFALDGDKEKCIEAGMDDYISKPIMIDDIRIMIEKWGRMTKSGSVSTTYGKALSDDLVDLTAIDRLKEISEKVDPAFMKQVFEMFFEQAPLIIKEIQQAVLQNNPDKMSQEAHKLKGTALNLGARAVAEKCRQLEMKGMNRDTTEADRMVLELTDYYRQTESALKSMVG